MKNIYWLSVIPVAVVGVVVVRSQVLAGESGVLFYSPCDTPIAYSIGKIDSGFDTTRERLLSDTKIAANVWSTTQNKPLFVYDPTSSFTINLVYDDRQELTSKINEMHGDLKDKQYVLDPKIEEFKKAQALFEQKITALNNEIKDWNSKGGAPKDEYEKLVARQKELQSESESLNAEARALGQVTREYNANAKALNQTIDSYEEVLEYKPEEGLYEQDGGKKSISIFIDVSHDEFLHTLTHEMGHALGLDHNKNKESIMFPQTTTSLKPSVDDIDALNGICKKRTVFEVLSTRFLKVIEVLRAKYSVNQ